MLLQDTVPLPAEVAGDAAESVLKWISETNVPPDVIQNVLSWTIKDKDLDNTKKFLFCFLSDGGYIKGDGKFEVDKIVKLAGSHKLKNEFKKHIEDCDKLAGSDKYDIVYKKAECYVKNSPIIFTL